jgi:hypothetical protein
MTPTTPKVLGPSDGRSGFLGSIGVRFMIDGSESGGGFSLVVARFGLNFPGVPI